MFRLNSMHKDMNPAASPPLEGNANTARRTEADTAPGNRRRICSGVLVSSVSTRGWRSTFMSV